MNIKKNALLFSGFISLMLGILGIALPVLPTTPFLLLAAWCFAQSSPKFHSWLMTHPKLGPPIKLWQARKAISNKAKGIAFFILFTSFISVMFFVQLPVLKVGVSILLICVLAFIVTRPSE